MLRYFYITVGGIEYLESRSQWEYICYVKFFMFQIRVW